MGVLFEEMVFVTTSSRAQRNTHEDFLSCSRPSCPRGSARFRPLGLSRTPAAAFLCPRHGLLPVGQSGAAQRLQGPCHATDGAADRGLVGGGPPAATADALPELQHYLQGGRSTSYRGPRPGARGLDLRLQVCGTVLDLRGASQPPTEDAAIARQTGQVFVLVPLLHASGLRVDACPDPNLVSLRHAGLSQWPPLAGTATGPSRFELRPTRQQVHRHGGLRPSPSPLGSASADALAAAFGRDNAAGPSGASAVAGTAAGELLLVGLPKRVGQRRGLPATGRCRKAVRALGAARSHDVSERRGDAVFGPRRTPERTRASRLRRRS